MCGFDGLEFVKKSIMKAIKLYPCVKINCVVVKNNLGIIDDFIEFVEKFNGKLIVRFLEVVPCGELYKKDKNVFKNTYVSFNKIKKRLANYGKLIPIKIDGDVPKSIYYKISGLQGIYSINPNYSVNYRCDRSKCPKLRVNPQGFVSNCTIQLKYVRDFRNKSLEKKIKMMKEIVREKLNRNYKGFRHKQKYYDFWRFGIKPDFIKNKFKG
jgi:molybdenum cofactor biosynthesis enzyme MoaA